MAHGGDDHQHVQADNQQQSNDGSSGNVLLGVLNSTDQECDSDDGAEAGHSVGDSLDPAGSALAALTEEVLEVSGVEVGMSESDDDVGQHGDDQTGNQNVVDLTGSGDLVPAQVCTEQGSDNAQDDLHDLAVEDGPAHAQVGADVDSCKSNSDAVGDQIAPCSESAQLGGDSASGEGVNTAGLGVTDGQFSSLQAVGATQQSSDQPGQDSSRTCVVHGHAGQGEDGAADAAAGQSADTSDQTQLTGVGFVRH